MTDFITDLAPWMILTVTAIVGLLALAGIACEDRRRRIRRSRERHPTVWGFPKITDLVESHHPSHLTFRAGLAAMIFAEETLALARQREAELGVGLEYEVHALGAWILDAIEEGPPNPSKGYSDNRIRLESTAAEEPTPTKERPRHRDHLDLEDEWAGR